MMSEKMICRKQRLSSFQIIILGFAGDADADVADLYNRGLRNSIQ